MKIKELSNIHAFKRSYHTIFVHIIYRCTKYIHRIDIRNIYTSCRPHILTLADTDDWSPKNNTDLTPQR